MSCNLTILEHPLDIHIKSTSILTCNLFVAIYY